MRRRSKKRGRLDGRGWCGVRPSPQQSSSVPQTRRNGPRPSRNMPRPRCSARARSSRSCRRFCSLPSSHRCGCSARAPHLRCRRWAQLRARRKRASTPSRLHAPWRRRRRARWLPAEERSRPPRWPGRASLRSAGPARRGASSPQSPGAQALSPCPQSPRASRRAAARAAPASCRSPRAKPPTLRGRRQTPSRTRRTSRG
mmetsp:Transcript_36180/g.84990  ORF Transcript_36180/g.84990 Transcript_36180/m.84990 type:complete len:200 (-) Transcript_36180:550-1149(-)